MSDVDILCYGVLLPLCVSLFSMAHLHHTAQYVDGNDGDDDDGDDDDNDDDNNGYEFNLQGKAFFFLYIYMHKLSIT